MKTPFSSMLLVFTASVIGSIAAVFLKAGANRLRSGWRDWIDKIGAGIALFLVSSYFYIEGLKHGSLTVLYPMVSLGYVWTLIWSRIFFGDCSTATRWPASRSFCWACSLLVSATSSSSPSPNRLYFSLQL